MHAYDTHSTPNMHGSSVFNYVTRIAPALSVLVLVTLLVFSFIVQPHGSGNRGHGDIASAATPWQIALSVYTAFLHVMAIAFPVRVFYALGGVIRNMKEAAAIKESPRRKRTQTLRNEKGTTTFPVPLFVVILPAYKEEMSTLEETLRVLASHAQARHSYHVRLYHLLLRSVIIAVQL